MNVLSMFDGISCGKVALDRLGIACNYYASEIDQNAIKISMDNHKEIVRLGDVKKVSVLDLPIIDLLIGGSPCQGFSSAGKKLGFKDERSSLIFEFFRLLDEARPKYFFLENVRMDKESEAFISNRLNVEPLRLCSSLVSAVRRPRLYWTNIPQYGVIPKDVHLHSCLEYEGDGYIEGVQNAFLPIIERHFLKIHTSSKPIYYCNEGYKTDTAVGKTKCRTLTARGNFPLVVDKNKTIRPITAREAARLMGLPPCYCSSASSAVARHAIGNAWQVDTIVELFSSLILF